MKLTIKDLQEHSYSFVYDGKGISGSIIIGMIGNSVFSIDDLAASCFCKRNVVNDDELNDFIELDDSYSYYEKKDALKFDDLSNLDIEEF